MKKSDRSSPHSDRRVTDVLSFFDDEILEEEAKERRRNPVLWERGHVHERVKSLDDG